MRVKRKAGLTIKLQNKSKEEKEIKSLVLIFILLFQISGYNRI